MRGWPALGVVVLASAALAWLARRRLAGTRAGRRLVAAPGATWALWALLGLATAALTAPLVAPSDPIEVLDLGTARLLSPSWSHPLGTDGYARDVLSRLLYGARTSVLIAAVAVALSATLGVLVGLGAGLAGRWLDALLMRGVDVALAVPRMFLVMVVIALWDHPTPLRLALLLGVTGWFGTSRLVRAEVLSLRRRDFVLAALALGASPGRVAARHVLPHVGATAAVAGTLSLANVILVEAGLAFLGLSIPAPAPTWGFMVTEATPYLRSDPWLAIVPGVAIALTVLAVNLLGDGLRTALNPREQT